MGRLNLKSISNVTETSLAAVSSQFSPWLTALLYPAGETLLGLYFGKLQVSGQEYIPQTGPVIYAPTHRSRWDALVVPKFVGRRVTGRDLRFMVSHDEMRGLQGWLISQTGGFPVDTTQPAIAALRYGFELLKAGESLVIFPEGNIFRDRQVQPLKPGLARLAIQAAAARPTPDVQIVPIGISYSQAIPCRGCDLTFRIGQPLSVANYNLKRSKQSAHLLMADLHSALTELLVESSPRRQVLVALRG